MSHKLSRREFLKGAALLGLGVSVSGVMAACQPAAKEEQPPAAKEEKEPAAKEEQKTGASGLQPDLGRRREPLEAFPLDTLRMVGTMEREGVSSALVQSPDGLVSRIITGNYLGQNYGKVVAVNQDSIDLIEIVPDGLGSWVQREASLALVE